MRAVHLQDGRRIEAQIILVAAGIQPNVDLAQDAKLEINRGVVVDAHMRSSDPAILAAGDVAEFDGPGARACGRPRSPRPRSRPRTPSAATRRTCR